MRAIVAVTLGFLWLDPSAEAAAIDPGPLAVLRPGHHVRVSTAEAEPSIGRFVGVEGGELIVEGPARRIRLDAVRAIHVRGRSTKSGALIGGITSAGVMGLLAAAFAAAYCESSCDGDVIAVAAVAGAAGATTGALIGSAVPAWRPLRPGTSAPTSDLLGSVSFDVTGNRGLDSLAPAGHVGGRLRLASERGRWSPGFELGVLSLGRSRAINGAGKSIDYHESLVHFGPTAAIALSRGAVRPYATLGAGYYIWHHVHPAALRAERAWRVANEDELIGASVGGGVRLRPGRPLSFAAEGRWHTHLTWLEPEPFNDGGRRLNVVSLNAGATLSW